MNLHKILFFTQTLSNDNIDREFIMYYNESNDSLSLKILNSDFFTQTINGINIFPAAGFELNEHLDIKKETFPFNLTNNWLGPYTLKSENFICLDFEKPNYFGICADLNSLTPFYLIPIFIHDTSTNKPVSFAICSGEFCLKQKICTSSNSGQVEVVKITTFESLKYAPAFLFRIWNHSSLLHHLLQNYKPINTEFQKTPQQGESISSFIRCLKDKFCVNRAVETLESTNYIKQQSLNEINKTSFVDHGNEIYKTDIPLSEHFETETIKQNNKLNTANLIDSDVINPLEKKDLQLLTDHVIDPNKPITPRELSIDISHQPPFTTPFNVPHDNQQHLPNFTEKHIGSEPISTNLIVSPSVIIDKTEYDQNLSHYIRSLEKEVQRQKSYIQNTLPLNPSTQQNFGVVTPPDVFKIRPKNVINYNEHLLNVLPEENTYVSLDNQGYVVKNEVYNTNPVLEKYINVIGNKTLPIRSYERFENTVPLLIPHSKFRENPRLVSVDKGFINDYTRHLYERPEAFLLRNLPFHITHIIDE
ncbi:hypothetical protein CDIK_3478 [Cucumispora dikerogammari]|nr:hypothetical protein CDIK_3478 [Cucumispora dikerogammari]